MIEDLFRRIPFERNGYDLCLMTRRTERISQTFRMDFRASTYKRYLNRGDENSHSETFHPAIA